MAELQLEKTLLDLQGDLRKLRFLAGHGELKKVHQIKAIKKSIARVKTEMKARKAGGKPTVDDQTNKVIQQQQAPVNNA